MSVSELVSHFHRLGQQENGMFKAASAFSSKVVIVTGSSAGIGAGTAVKFAKEGAAAVVIHGRKADALEKVKADVEKAGSGVKVHVVVGDVTEDQVRQRLINETVEKFGRLDVLVNNAAVSHMPGLAADASIDIYDNMFNINVRSLILVTQLAIPHLIKTKGAIVNISSIAALRARPIFTYYNMSKIAVDHYSRCLAVELGPKGVRVNCVNPGYIEDTDLSSRQGATPEMIKQFATQSTATYPLRRAGTVNEVADLIIFLASEKSSFMTGTITPIDGGAILA